MTQTDLTGRNLGGYRILRKLGQGGMAVVYKAHEESLSRVVALKVIAQHLSNDAQFIERFKREAQAAAQLSHPSIVQIYAIGEDDGVHYFSMEYIKGLSLAEIIEQEGFLTAGRALPIIEQAAEALAVAHEAGIVHRDIKPANIMLDSAGRVKVADFGIAQMATQSRMTQSGMLVGTPEYISPEQCRNEQLDGRSDIYALGVTLYQLLSGRTPFDADTPAALVFQIIDGPIPSVGSLNPTIPPDVQDLVAKMMHTDRKQRFQSAEDLIHALKDADTQPVTGDQPALGAAAVAGAAAASTVVMDGPTAEPAATMSPQATAAGPTGPTEAIPENTEVMSDETEAIPAQQAVPASKPSPATDAYAHGGGNRATLIGIAALVIVVVALLFAGWQLMGLLGADETIDPDAAARQAALPAAKTKTAPGTATDNDEANAGTTTTDNDAVQTDASESRASGDAAADNDTTPAPETPAVTASAPASSPRAQSQATVAGVGVGAEPTAQAQPTRTATEQAAAMVQQQRQPAQPPPAQPQPQVEEPVMVAPPINSIVAVTSGEYEYVDLVNTWFEGAFADQQFEIIDFLSLPPEMLHEVARFQVVTTATLISTQPLEYFGNIQTQYTVALTTRVNDLGTGVTVVGPENTTLRYTSINMEQNLRKASTDLARSIRRALRALIHRP